MLQLELPHINVLSKIDLITSYGDLPFNLDFYTEVQDLSYLQYELEKDPRSSKYAELNKAICDIVEDFSLVGFQTLCVEVRTSSMVSLSRVALMITTPGQAIHGSARQVNRSDAWLHTKDHTLACTSSRGRQSCIYSPTTSARTANSARAAAFHAGIFIP